MDQKVRKQILSIRGTGLTNMFDIQMVQRIAFDSGYYELVTFLEDFREEYIQFILHGDGENA
ncbi:MAG: DUF5049 domain-containing protein [Eubacterium sp.]|jgi:hypothetical protein|nr:DUF5049 domain-containing protein [Eubacterium sp.]